QDALSGREAGHPRTHGDNDTGRALPRHERPFGQELVTAANHQRIDEICRNRLHPDQHLVRHRNRDGHVRHGNSPNRAELAYDSGLHGFPPPHTRTVSLTGTGTNAPVSSCSATARLRILPLAVSGISGTTRKYSGWSYFERPAASRCSKISVATGTWPS